jgi:hypothetical protein
MPALSPNCAIRPGFAQRRKVCGPERLKGGGFV